jgi:alkylation response protein AidB-like acyl-CoA dehydrogenase
MDLELTDEQELFRSTTRRFIESTCPLTSVRALADAEASADDGYLRQAAELGWFAMLVPEALGGGSVSGHGVADASVAAEERGRLLQPGAFVPMNVVAHAIAAGGTEAMRADVLPALVAGARVATWAVANPAGDFDPARAVTVTPAGPGHGAAARLTGVTSLVQDAHLASWFLVAATDADGCTQYLVRADRPGIHVARKQGFDLGRQVADVRFDDVEVTDADVVGERGGGTAAVDRQLDVACVLTVAESVGAMDHLFDLAVDYAKVRTAFGRPIGSFQAVKHQLADAALLLEESKAISVAATRAVQAAAGGACETASMAKSFVGDAGVEVAHVCWQVFGGIGYTWEHDLHLYLRRLTLDAALYGDPAWHRERICRLHGLGG